MSMGNAEILPQARRGYGGSAGAATTFSNSYRAHELAQERAELSYGSKRFNPPLKGIDVFQPNMPFVRTFHPLIEVMRL